MYTDVYVTGIVCSACDCMPHVGNQYDGLDFLMLHFMYDFITIVVVVVVSIITTAATGWCCRIVKILFPIGCMCILFLGLLLLFFSLFQL